MKEQFIIAFTGTRPSEISSYDWNDKRNKLLRNHMKAQLRQIFDTGEYTDYIFISGMALGVDQFAISVLIELQAEYEDLINIRLEAAIPFKLQYTKWNKEQRTRYHTLLKYMDIITYVDTIDKYKDKTVEEGAFSEKKLHLRNHYIIDKCNLLMAYPILGKKSGGTRSAIKYAISKNKKIYMTEIIAKKL